MKKQFLIVVLIGFMLCCQRNAKTTPNVEQQCIDKALTEDDAIGKLRNDECKTLSISQTISNYTARMKLIDMESCPETFTKAYASHRKAWEDVVPITDNYPELRGEMHDVFKQIEAGKDSVLFKKRVAAVWATWAEVEKEAGVQE